VALLGATPFGQAMVSVVPRNSVGPLQLKRNAVGPQNVAPNAVHSAHVLDGSLLASDFKAGQTPPPRRAIRVRASQPLANGTGWIGGTLRIASGSWTITVWALCAKVS
jgi:hypothetical protein